MIKGFEAGLEELENNPTVKSDIENAEDLDEFLEGKLQLDISNWIDAGLINMESFNTKGDK